MSGTNDAAEPAADTGRWHAGSWYVYILATARGTLYTGITTDVKRRLREHRGTRRGARFFRFTAAKRLLYVEAHDSRSSASRREAAIKRMTRRDKLALIGQAHPQAQPTVLDE